MQIYINPQRHEWDELARRSQIDASVIGPRVAEILNAVRERGDEALRDYARTIDGVELDTLTVSEAEIEAAASQVSPELKAALETAAANIRKFHTAELPAPVEMETTPGVRCIQRAVPIQRVGLYIPGGSAPLFSTVLMLAIPAQVAGCPEIVLCTPPNRQGGIAPEILCAARLCGVHRIVKAGGAQAIGAMAYGTRSVPRVDKIFGPGNQYVTVAKQQVSVSQVAIDMPAGPSEVLVLADETADPSFVAADLLSQAEHGPDSQAMLVTTSRGIADRVVHAVDEQLRALGRAAIAERALEHSRILVMDSPDEIVEFANRYAAEHLIISMRDPWQVAGRITAAGSVFIGNLTPESAGDYASGTNHTLPTYGWARSFSGVNIDSFMRKITYQEITPDGLRRLGPTIETMAAAEGLSAHRNAVTIRLKTL
ncbi:MAG: histidinol dehydrogenase [Rikenellaceae bacterium]|nr:histidinol dehydrogenase [Rikenellaceae bacterium]